MTDFVDLYWKRNRGWPWPEESWGLTPMFGEDGWCRSCGVPKRSQSGSLVLQRKGLKVEGAWVPNWCFDVICVERAVAAKVEARFGVETRPVKWPATSPGQAMQLVIPTVGDAWFDEQELREATIARHGTDGARCPDCGTWRWMPLHFDLLPPLRITLPVDDQAIAASPEWFGDGMQAFRKILVQRELAELLAAASPRDFTVRDILR